MLVLNQTEQSLKQELVSTILTNCFIEKCCLNEKAKLPLQHLHSSNAHYY